MSKKTEDQFQTPMPVANYMAELLPTLQAPKKHLTFFEPTPGQGNLIRAAKHRCSKWATVSHPIKNFFDIDPEINWFDAIIMNPPFSEKTAFGIPADLDLKGMRLGYYILKECMKMSDNIIALMPWFTMLDSDVRMRELKAFGIKSLTSLPRKTFEYARIQTVVIELQRGHQEETIFKTFNF